MKLTITVVGQPTTNSAPIQCEASFEVDAFDQQAISQLAHVAQQCDSVVRSASRSGVGPLASMPDQRTHHASGSGSKARLATEKQCNAIKAMAKRQDADLDQILHDEFAVSAVSALTIRDASTLIDRLKNSILSAS